MSFQFRLARLTLIALALQSTLSACSTTALPNLAAAERNMPIAQRWTKPVIDHRPAHHALVAVRSNWWHDLGSDELSALIENALQQAPDSRIAQLRVQQARAQAELALADVLPQIGLSASANRSRQGTSSEWTSRYQWGLDSNWELPFFSSKIPAIAASEHDLAAAQWSLADAQLTLSAEVARQYLRARLLYAKYQLTQHSLALQASTYALLEHRVTAGLQAALELERGRSSLWQTESAAQDVYTAYHSAVRALALLSGQDMQQFVQHWQTRYPESQANHPLTQTVPDQTTATANDIANSTAAPTPRLGLRLPAIPNIPTIPLTALKSRPDVRKAEQDAQAQIERGKASDRERYPSLSLSASLGWSALNVAGLGLAANMAQSLVSKLSTALFDAGRLKTRAHLQAVTAEQAVLAYEKTLLTAVEEIEAAMQSWASNTVKQTQAAQVSMADGEVARLRRIQFQAGLADYDEVLSSERSRLASDQAQLQAQADALQAWITLVKALGGAYPIGPIGHEGAAGVQDWPSNVALHQ